MEQFANLIQTTLASNYTTGSGSMSLTSASGVPSGGTFSITIVDQTTKLVKLIWRVASRSGTTLTGAAESSDVNCNAGDLVYGTMLSAAAMAQIETDVTQLFTSGAQGQVPASGGGTSNFLRADGNWAAPGGGGGGLSVSGFFLTDGSGNYYGPILKVTLPVFADFNWLTSQGSATATSSGGAIVLFIPSSSGDFVPVFGQAISSNTSLTVLLNQTSTLQEFISGGIALYESGTGKIVTFVLSMSTNVDPGQQQLIVQHWNSSTSFNANVFIQGTSGSSNGVASAVRPCWLRITIVSGNYVFSVSYDGINFVPIYSESVTSFFTTGADNWGLSGDANNSGGNADVYVTLFSWSNP